VDKTVEVYLSIPSGKTGKGKSANSVNGAFHHMHVVRKSTNPTVKVIAVENNLLIVEKIKPK
jgi:hypothetical protein